MQNEKENVNIRSYVIKGILSVLAIWAYGLINYMLNPIATLASGKMAVKQFESSDASYVVSRFGMDFFSHLGVPAIVLLAVLILIWWKPIKAFFTAQNITLVLAAMILLSSTQAFAYYAKEDYADPYFILPNESAFFVQDAGDNLKDQGKFGTEAYLRENKIPAKRFEVPHAKLPNSGLWSNYYVPTGRLIIVDRTPFNREWVKDVHRGSGAKNEGFPVQSKEGINITVGIAISASVSEDDSPKFLFRFGVKPPAGDRTKPEVIFTSVYYGKSLTEVMDGVVRNKVQSLLGAEFISRTFDQCNNQSAEIIKSVEDKLAVYMKAVGITLDYVGWADTFEFDEAIQQAINRRYIAGQDKAIAEMLAQQTQIMQSLATTEAIRNFGSKTDGKLPMAVSVSWLPSSFGEFFGNLFKSTPDVPTKK